LAGGIGHMYEWGTIGVNKGRSNMRIHPQNPKSKLWTNVATGTGLNRNIVWVYRPSVATVPKPTVGETGMAPDVIASMRSHHFTWKAQVIEEGHTVTIKPDDADFLLIPATRTNIEKYPKWFKQNDINRGYTLTTKTITSQPGGEEDPEEGEPGQMGTFTAIWDDFWVNRSGEMMESDMAQMVESDYFPEIFNQRAPGMMIPARQWQLRTKIKENEKAVQKRVDAKAKMRAQRIKAKRAGRKAKR
jgi:hypothetical protein